LVAAVSSSYPTHDSGRFDFCDLVFRDPSATAVTGDLLTEAIQEPLASCDAAFSCLLKLGGRSVGSEVEAVRCRNVVNGETLPISRLIELAADLGLKAEHAGLDWQRLQSLGFNHPLLVVLKNTNVILLTGGGREGVSEVAVWDPGNPYGEILFLPREDFERASTGHALIITMPPSNGAETSPSSDFCWFTSAGIELLAKTPARGKNPKRLVQGQEEDGTRPKSPARQTDRATAPAMHAEFAVARVELANRQPPLNPAEGTQLSIPALSRPVVERRLSPLVCFCIAVSVILAVAGSGTFLLKSSVTGAVAAAIAFAKDVWAVAPNGAPSTDDRIERGPRTVSAPIPAPPTAPVGELGTAASLIEPAAPRVERTAPRLAARPVPPITGPYVGAPRAAPAADWDGVPASVVPAAKRDGVAPSAIRSAVPEAAAAPVISAAAPKGAAAPAIPAAAPKAATAPAIPAAVTEAAAAPATSAAAPKAATAPAISAAAPKAAAAPAIPAAVPEAAAAPAIPAAVPEAAAPSAAPRPGLGAAAAAPGAQQAASPPPPTSPRLSTEEMATLLARGDSLLSVGDVASARLFYERVADAGGGLAAIRLGETFDQFFLDRVRLRGVRGDPGAALFWYRRARDLGATDAEVLMKALEAK
jgi:hypothetical protein